MSQTHDYLVFKYLFAVKDALIVSLFILFNFLVKLYNF